MGYMDKETKSVWNDISKVWVRIAGVIAAVGVLATFVTKIFHTAPDLTYSLFAISGLFLLIISFYVDKQSEYTYQEIVKYRDNAKEEFLGIMLKAKQETLDMKEDSNNKIDALSVSVNKILEVSEETRKDTLRIQLLMLMKEQDNNIDTILKLAETYFVDLHGDWYMTSEFNKWAKAHDVVVPSNIYQAIDTTHKN